MNPDFSSCCGAELHPLHDNQSQCVDAGCASVPCDLKVCTMCGETDPPRARLFP